MLEGGYQVLEELNNGLETKVFRALRKSDRKPVILKVLNEDYPNPERIAGLQREYELLNSLNSGDGQGVGGVIAAYGFERFQQTYMIVLEDIGGNSLRWYLERAIQDQQTFVSQLEDGLIGFVQIALKIASILGQLHQHQVIHKDLTPSNIIYNPLSQQIRIIDFGIASKTDTSVPVISSPVQLMGTLAYISPEQTGRVNRPIDYRTDFYSLGVTFYELLTGHNPFFSNDALEIVYGHIARQPIPPWELYPALPKPLSSIVMKMLEKDVSQRYQSARGLVEDLQDCLDMLGNCEPCITANTFVPGRHDLPKRFQISKKLYGRQQELTEIASAFERVGSDSGMFRQGGPLEVILVEGQPGIGKTSLVQEAYKSLIQQNGYFVAGKYDQLQHNKPYFGILQAIRSLIRQILTKSEVEVANFRQKILANLGQEVKIVFEAVPEAALIFGSQLTTPSSQVKDSQSHYRLALQSLLESFCQLDHPLVIFLDDLQWIDQASLELIQLLAVQETTGSLLLIGAYRNNEIGPEHPLKPAFKAVKESGKRVTEIILPPLGVEPVCELLADTLFSSTIRCQDLAELLVSKTDGNPFFLIEYLRDLYKEDLVFYDLQRDVWDWKLEEIRSRVIAENVVDLLVGKISQLSQPAQEILKLAACIGNPFDLKLLSCASQMSMYETAKDLLEAVAAGLVLPLSYVYDLNNIRFWGELDELVVEFRFSHDRIQQAAYSLIPAFQTTLTHLKIGRSLIEKMGEEGIQTHLFEIANQYNLGVEQISSQDEKILAARINFRAGQMARASGAYSSAMHYFKAAINLLDKSAWQTQYEFVLSLYTEAAWAAFFFREVDCQDYFLQIIFQNARSALDCVPAYDIQTRILVASNRHEEAIQKGLWVLEQLGVHIPENLDEAITLMQEEAFELLEEHQPADLLELPVMCDSQKLAAVELLMTLMPPAFVKSREMFLFIVLKRVTLMLQYGNSPELVDLYNMLALMMVGVPGWLEQAYDYGKFALGLLDRPETKSRRTFTLYGFNVFIRCRKEFIGNSLSDLMAGFQAGMEDGDFLYAGRALFAYMNIRFSTGYSLLLLEQDMLAWGNLLQQQAGQDIAWSMHEIYHQVVVNLIHKLEAPWILSGSFFDEFDILPEYLTSNEQNRLFNVYFLKAYLNFLFGNYSQALDYIERAEKFLGSVAGTYNFGLFDFFDALIRLSIYNILEPDQQEIEIQKIMADRQKLVIWAKQAPDNFEHKLTLVDAEIGRIFGRWGDAREAYDLSIREAQKRAFVNEEALAYELAGLFYRQRGFTQLANYYLRSAHAAYLRWGAVSKVRALEENVPELGVQEDLHLSNSLHIGQGVGKSQTPKTAQFNADSLDLISVIKASQAISGEIVLDRLMTRLIKIVIENAGAEKGYLILERSRQGSGGPIWMVEAEGKVASADLVVKTDLQLPLEQAISGPAPLLPGTIVNYALRTQSEVVLPHAASILSYGRDNYVSLYQPKSILCVPLLYQGRVVGLIYLENDLVTGAFTQERLRVLSLLSSQMVISLENALLYTDLEVRVQARTAELYETNLALTQEIVERQKTEGALRLSQENYRNLAEAERQQRALAEAMRDTAAALNSTLDYEEVLGLILTCLSRVFQYESASIALIQGEQEVSFKRVKGYQERHLDDVLLKLNLRLDDFPLWKKMASDHLPLVVEDTRQMPGWVTLRDTSWILSYACLPILSKGKMIGFLNLDSSQIGYFKQDKIDLLKIFANQAAVAIENARLFGETQHLARIDGLTRLYNRQHLFELAEREFERARRFKHDMALVMFDIDHFKNINDAYGHPVGDIVLRKLAKCCISTLREIDILGRYGGEEFLVVMPETNQSEAQTAAERLRKEVAHMEVEISGQRIKFTVSMGISSYSDEIHRSLDELIQSADMALYEAKASGRNNVKVFRNDKNNRKRR